jgi:ribosome-associated protein
VEYPITPSSSSHRRIDEAFIAQLSTFLDSQKAENISVIDLRNKAVFADFMVIASGPSQRFLKALAEKTQHFFKEKGCRSIAMEGLTSCDWVLIDAQDVVVHLFRPEVREIYALEKMWAPSFTDPKK